MGGLLRRIVTTLTPLHWAWAMGLALSVAAAETVAVLLVRRSGDVWAPTLLEMVLWYVATAVMTLIGLALVESDDRGVDPPVLRYLAVVLVVALLAGAGWFAVVEVSSAFSVRLGLPDFNAPLRLTSRNAVPLWFGRLVVGVFAIGGAVFTYVYLRNSARMARALASAEARSAETRRALLANDLVATQALVDPGFLFDTFMLIEQRYDEDPAAGDHVLEALIAYLRAALPLLESEPSTIGRQGQLVLAYLQVEQARIGDRLGFAVDVPPELAAIPFPPLLVLPLVDLATRAAAREHRACSVSVRFARDERHITVTVRQTSLPDDAALFKDESIAAVRGRLAGLYGERASLRVHDEPGGVTARIEVPIETSARDHR